MGSPFTEEKIKKIAKVLDIQEKNLGNYYRMVLENPDNKHRLALEIYPDIPMGEKSGVLISIYTTNTHLQLQFCTGFVISESLGEVTFFGETDKKVTGLIVDKTASCSIYANVDRSILSGDLSKLGPEVMMSSIALSLTEQELQ
jgi:hypothetical protein